MILVAVDERQFDVQGGRRMLIVTQHQHHITITCLKDWMTRTFSLIGLTNPTMNKYDAFRLDSDNQPPQVCNSSAFQFLSSFKLDHHLSLYDTNVVLLSRSNHSIHTFRNSESHLSTHFTYLLFRGSNRSLFSGCITRKSYQHIQFTLLFCFRHRRSHRTTL